MHPEPALGRGAHRDAGPHERDRCPYLQAVADHGIDAALRAHPDLARGTYVYRGRCASEPLARAFGVEWQRLPGRGE